MTTGGMWRAYGLTMDERKAAVTAAHPQRVTGADGAERDNAAWDLAMEEAREAHEAEAAGRPRAAHPRGTR